MVHGRSLAASARVRRFVSFLVVAAWLVQMGLLVRRAYLQATPVVLAADLGRYGSGAQWKGVYYRGEKIGFSVSQTTPSESGFELQEDGRLQMNLMGAATAVRVRTLARVDHSFALQSFSFSLDAGTGATEIEGVIDGRQLRLTVKTPAGTREETRDLPEPPALSMNLPRRLAARGLEPGQTLEVSVFDPATLRNAPMTVEVQKREVVQAGGRPVPAFRVQSRFAGLGDPSKLRQDRVHGLLWENLEDGSANVCRRRYAVHRRQLVIDAQVAEIAIEQTQANRCRAIDLLQFGELLAQALVALTQDALHVPAQVNLLFEPGVGA